MTVILKNVRIDTSGSYDLSNMLDGDVLHSSCLSKILKYPLEKDVLVYNEPINNLAKLLLDALTGMGEAPSIKIINLFVLSKHDDITIEELIKDWFKQH